MVHQPASLSIWAVVPSNMVRVCLTKVYHSDGCELASVIYYITGSGSGDLEELHACSKPIIHFKNN